MDYDTYLSPFSWRYASQTMRQVWSETNKRRLWRRLWVTLAETQAEYGLVTEAELADLRTKMDAIDVPRAMQIEADIHHDLMAELKTFAEQAPVGGRILHLGATSMDIEDNADALRLRQSLELVMGRLDGLLGLFSEKILAEAETPVMAFTHLQPAEPSTLGYRLALYAQDLLIDREQLSRARRDLKGKGFKGAVGTGAAYAELLGDAGQLAGFEARLSARLGLAFFSVASQVYPRKQDYLVVSALAGLGASLYKFAFDLRLLQSPMLGELSEPFGSRQVGSSAMPFKRNPINAEKIDSLARQLAGLPRLAWDNAAHSLLERTLDDSANRRSLLPEAFLIVDELLGVASRLLQGLVIDRAAMQRNLQVYGPFAASERFLMAAAKKGADRQDLHERLRQHAMTAWETIRSGGANPLVELILNDAEIRKYLSEEELQALVDTSQHLGDGPTRARQLANEILAKIQ